MKDKWKKLGNIYLIKILYIENAYSFASETMRPTPNNSIVLYLYIYILLHRILMPRHAAKSDLATKSSQHHFKYKYIKMCMKINKKIKNKKKKERVNDV